MSIAYSDGVAIEAHIDNLVLSATDRSSAAAIAQDEYHEWPVRYHLCPERSNLFRHLNLDGLDILEMGAGMGGVSRHLAERAKSFFAVEGTEERFQVLKHRLADLSNWDGVVSNLEDFSTDRKFDVVCIIGVLEYSELYITTPDGSSPHKWLLNHATSFLKPGGVLILAIENQYGLKYWAGAPEDHTERMFDGICGYNPDKTARTFSRIGLGKMFNEVGLDAVEEFYPWPDYKIPEAVVSKRIVDSDPALAADIAADSVSRDPKPSLQLFPTPLAIRQAINSGMIADISNSLLFVASSQTDSPTYRQVLGKMLGDKEGAWHYSLQRKHPTVTAFTIGSEHAPSVVTKSLLKENLEVIDEGLISWVKPAPAPVLIGPKLSHLLKQAAYFGGATEYEDLLVRYLRETLTQFEISSTQLRPEAYDAVPQNAILNADGLFQHFDLEWKLKQPMAKSWFLFRSVLNEAPNAKILPSGSYPSLFALYEIVCHKLHVPPEVESALQQEVAIQSAIVQRNRHVLHESISSYFHKPLESNMFPRNPNTESFVRKQINADNVGVKMLELHNEVQRLRKIVDRRSVKLVLSVTQKLKALIGKRAAI